MNAGGFSGTLVAPENPTSQARTSITVQVVGAGGGASTTGGGAEVPFVGPLVVAVVVVQQTGCAVQQFVWQDDFVLQHLTLQHLAGLQQLRA